MFTSGSTGLPKGVVHTGHALVTKRFARAAALPAVGDDEMLLCYLPLFHTFGRYLEMLGMLFWGGTYVFAGNPSFETLARALPAVRPDRARRHPAPLGAAARALPRAAATARPRRVRAVVGRPPALGALRRGPPRPGGLPLLPAARRRAVQRLRHDRGAPAGSR